MKVSFATYVPTDYYYGADEFTFQVSDGELTDNASVSLFVNSVNDAPVLATLDNVSFDEDSSGGVTLSATDIDGDNLTYSVTTGTDIVATLDGSDLSFSAPADFNGTENFTVSVTDGDLTDSQVLTVTIAAVNDAPIAATGITRNTNEEEIVIINLLSTDIDSINI